ncbi:MAG: hypothetical protein B6I30_01015 [Desulfobacteraceae bacterium 4572_187]|nr:MAG: hypothetical protein B6I30_01015 [Desulfobacteraceae bacterium 4572_187]
MKFFDKLFATQRPPKSAAKLGRNDVCWCGSGLKYKKCHYESDRQYFSKFYSTSCRTSS